MPEQDYDLPLYQSPDGEFFSLTPEQASSFPDYKPLGFTYRDAIAGGRQRIVDEPSISKTAAQMLLGLEEGATVTTPRAIGGGLEAASGLLPENYGGAALRKIGREAREGAGQIGKEYEDLSEGVGGGGAAKFARGLGSSVIPSASALLAAAPLGVLGAGAGATVTGSAVASGLQSLGGTFADAFEANKKRGMSDEEAYRKSYTPAILSGLVTGLVTKGFGGTGLEPILLGKAVPKGFSAAVREVAKDVGMEAVEEATDEAWQAVIRSTTFNPEATAEENLQGIIQAGIAGGLMAGAVRGAQSAPSAVNDLFAGKRPTAPTPPPLPVQPAPVAPVAPATPAAITPAATLPAPAPVAPVVQPVAAQPIQQAPPKEQLTPPTAAQRSELEDIRGDLEAAQLAGDTERVKYLTNLLRVKEREAWTKKVTVKPRRVAITPEAQAAAPKPKPVVAVDAQAIAENRLDQAGPYPQETPELKQSVFRLFLKKAASAGITDVGRLSRLYASEGMSGTSSGASLSAYLASADGTGRDFGDKPADSIAWEFKIGRNTIPVTWGDLASEGIAQVNPDGTIRGSGFGAPSPAITPEAQAAAPAVRASMTTEVSNLSELINQGGGQVRITDGGVGVAFDKFALSIDGDEATVGYVELKDKSQAGSGIGKRAYIALGRALLEKGITLKSSGALLGPGHKLWTSLVRDGYAIREGSGYSFTGNPLNKPPQPRRVAITPEAQAAAPKRQQALLQAEPIPESLKMQPYEVAGPTLAVSNLPKNPPKTYEEAQRRIDSLESELSSAGVDVLKLYDPSTTTAYEQKILESAGWKPKPAELTKAYAERDAIGASQMKESQGDIKAGLRKIGLTDSQAAKVMKSYYIDPEKSGAFEQAMASQETRNRAVLPQEIQAQDVAYILASENNQMFDELRDVNRDTLGQAAQVVQFMQDYLGIEKSFRVPPPARQLPAGPAKRPEATMPAIPVGELGIERGRVSPVDPDLAAAVEDIRGGYVERVVRELEEGKPPELATQNVFVGKPTVSLPTLRKGFKEVLLRDEAGNFFAFVETKDGKLRRPTKLELKQIPAGEFVPNSQGNPISAMAFDVYGTQPREGYTREGDIYIFRQSTPPAEVAPAVAAKEPWEMTRADLIRGLFSEPSTANDFIKRLDEFDSLPAEKQKAFMRDKYPDYAYAGRMTRVTGDGQLQAVLRLAPHRAAVEAALREGKTIPPAVLSDYPELKQAAGKAAEETFEQKMAREEDANDWIKAELQSKRPATTAEEAWLKFTAFDRARGVEVLGKDYFVSAWGSFGKPAKPAENPFDTSASSKRLTELQSSKPRPIVKFFGASGGTPEQRAAHEAKIRKWNSDYRKALKNHKELVEKSNEWIRSQKGTPSTQPPYAPQEQAPVEVLRNQPPGTPAQVAEGKPREVSEAAGEGAPEKRDKSKPEQMTPEEWGYWYEESVSPKLKSRKVKLGQGQPKDVRAFNAGLNDFAERARLAQPLSASAVDTYGIKLPPGYIREGDLYVYRPEVKPEEGRGVIPKEGVGSIYQMERGGETKWLVQEGEKRGFGDSIFDTEQEAVAESQREATRREQRAESLRRLDAEKSAEAKAKAEREDLGTFTDGMSPMKRGSVVKQLTARFRYLGKEMSRRDIIRELVNQGRKVEVEEGQRVLSNDKGEYLGEKVLTKAGLDYAEHLIQERDAQMSLGQTPTARPAPSLSKMQVEQAVRELFDGNTPPNFQVTHNYGKTFKAKFPLGIFDGTTLTAKSSQAPTAGQPVAVVLKDGTKVGTYDPNTGGFAFTASAPAAGAELFFQQARTVRGWYDADTGTIWLNAAYLRSPQEARAVFAEEAMHAVQNDPAVQEAMGRLVGSLSEQQLSEKRTAYGNIPQQQLEMEAVSDFIKDRQLRQDQMGLLAQLWDAVLGAVQRLYGKFTGKVFTERDAQDILAKALKAAAVGKRSLKAGGEVYAEGGLAAKAKAFFSRLFRTVEQSQQNKASGAQWKATIKNSKLGANLDEMALVGVNDLEDGKMYSRQEVLDYLQANQVEVKDVTLGGMTPEQQVRYDYLVAKGARSGVTNLTAAETSEWMDLRNRKAGNGGTHFSTYQLPGAKEGSYREVLLTVPGDTRYVIEQHDYGTGEISDPFETSFTIRNLVTGKESESFETREEAEKLLQEKGRGSLAKWSDGHSQYSSIANPIVRLRFNERQTQDGKRMLFLEEVQAPQKDNFEKMPPLFQKNWREIAFKWALRHAAENGFEVIGWTTGQQQAGRYNLSASVSHIEWGIYPRWNGKHVNINTAQGPVTFVMRDGKVAEVIGKNAGNIVGKPIEDVVGKGVGEKILTEDSGRLEGEGLNIGGEGLKKLYDVDFRNVVNKLPAVRNAGGKAGVAEIVVGTPNNNFNRQNSLPLIPNETATVHSLNITPAIADSVMGGQAMFSAGSPQNQLDQKYFEAIQRGDMQEVQALVDEAARGAGYDSPEVYRGDRIGKTTFTGREDRSNFIQGNVFFSSEPAIAAGYAPNNRRWKQGYVRAKDLQQSDGLYRAKLNISNPLIVDARGEGWDSVPFNGKSIQIDDLAVKARELGHDGLIVKDVVDQYGTSDQYVVFNPSQIKSSDPITYDDSGNIIPLSQRFQQESPDIRYSLGEPVKGIANENTGTIRGDDSIGASQEPSQNQQRLRPLYQDQGLQAGASGFSVQNASRVAKDLESSGAVLWGTEPEIEAAYLDANSDAIQAGKPTPPTLTGGQVFRGPVYPGTKATSEGVSGKPRVLITRAAKSLLLLGQSNSDILAHRFLFGADKASNHRDFNLGLFQKLPKLRIVFEPVGAAPLAAYYRSYDTIIVNQAKLDGFDLSNPATAALLDAVISEELIHAAVNRLATNEEILSAWTGLSDMERKTAKDIYGITNPVDGFTDIQFANEYLRLVLQQRLSGKTTEQVVPISSQLKKILQKLVDFLKRSFGNKPENSVARQLVERIEGAIRGNAPIKQPLFPSSGEALATNISQSDATEVQGRAIEPSVIAAAGRAVADLGRQTVEEYEQAGRELEGLAYESKAFRQARSELNNLVSIHEGRLRQLPQDRVTDDMRADIRDGVSIENGQIVVGDELVTKLAQMGVQARPELVKAMQAEVHFEQQARRLVDNLGKLATLKELKDYYTRINAPADEIENLNKLIAAKEKVVANLTPVTINRGNDQQSIGERASEITRADASKVELQAKRDALNLEPVQEFFGKGIAELRDLSEKAKAAADLTRALMDSTTSVSELARLGAIYDKWASFDATVKDALVKGTLTDEQRVAVLTDLQKSFHEFDSAKFRMDDLLNSEEKGLLKDIREAEAAIADAKVTSGLADVLVADALKAAKGEMGLTGTVGDAANIANLEASTGAITTLAMNLGRTIDQNRWLYDFLVAPGDMPAFGASVAQSLGISETALREILKVVQQSPSLASAIVTLTDDAAAKLAASPPLQMQAIAPLATSGNALAMTLAANLTSQIVQQANAQGTKANAARQAAARQLAQSVLRLRTLQQGQALFNQTANSPAFQQLRGVVSLGASEAQKMVVLGPTGPVLRGFKTTAKEYQPELKINVESDALELQRTRDKVWKYLQNAEQYVEDYEAAAAAHAANPANPSPSQLGFDVADYNGLKFAIENQIVPMFLNMGDMDDAARAAQYLTPVGVRKLMKLPAFLGQIFLQYEQLGKMVGGFAGNTFRQQIAKYKRGYLNAKKVASQFQDLPKLQSAAMQSHNIKNEDAYRKIFNEMAHYGRLFGTPLRVGFKLPVSNQVVTKADMEFLKRTLAFEEKLRREVTEVDPVTGVRYMRGGKEITRKGAYVGDLGMPRHMNRGATHFIADVTSAYAGTPKGFTPTTDLSTSSQDEVVKYWNEHLGTLKQHILDSLRTDRSFKQSAEMAAAEKRIAARWLAGNMNQVNSVQDLVDLIAAEIPATNGKNPLDTAREGLNNELLQYVAHAERIQKDRAEDNAKTSGLSIALSSENEYTKPAAYLELPSEYYDYGAVSSVDRITAQARSNHSTLIDFANSIRLAITELRNRLDRLKMATTDKERALILENYKGNPQEMEDVLELLTTSLKNFEDSYRAGGPDIVPTRLGQKLLKAAVGSVLAKVEIAIRNLSQGQLQVFTNLRAMNYMSASLAAWKALSNVPRGMINTSYMVARNIAGFADRRLGRDPQFQRTLRGAVDVVADAIFKTAQAALFKPMVGAENVRKSFERVFNLGFDTSGDSWDAIKQAWIDSGQFRNQIEQDKAMKTRTSRAIHLLDRLANTALDSVNAVVRGSVLESSDTGMNALSLGLVGNMEQRLEEVAMVFGKRLTDLGITRIDPTDKRAVLQPHEWLPSMNQQTAANSLGEIRKFLESSASSEGFQLEKNLLQYYQDKMAGRPAEIFNQRTFDAVQRSMIAENNAALPTNRASAGQSSTLWRTLLTLQGYPADAFLKMLRIATGGTRNRKAVLQAASKISLALGVAALAIIVQGSGDAGAELWKRKMQGKRADRPTPLDADFYTDPDHLMRAMGNYLLLSSYYVGDIIRGAYGWADGRSTIDPLQKAFALATASQIARDISSGVKIAMKGGTTAEVLAPLRKSITRLTFGAPEIEQLLGKERDNTDAARRGITENAKAKGFDLPSPGFSGTVGLTNIKRKAISQAVSDMEVAKRKGDTDGYNKAKAEAQKQIAELEAYYLKQRLEAGDSPEVAARTAKSSVWSDYQDNNPVTAALGGKRPTAEQYKQLVESSTGERGEVIRQGIKAWQDGAQALFGKPGNITKEDVAENRSGGTVKEPSYGRVSLTGGVSGRMRSVGTTPSRGRRAKIRRVSLTGRRRRISPLRGRRKKIRRVRLTA